MFNLFKPVFIWCFAVGSLSGHACFAESLADRGDSDAQYKLGVRYLEGDGVERSAEKAVMLFRKAAERGHAAAQNGLGVCYDKGEGVGKSAEQAVLWYRRSAEQGYAVAQCNLGLCYANGEGVEKSAEKAVMWYRRSAEQGYAAAQNSLGLCYDNGEGVGKSAEQAVLWYRRSAEQGYAVAQYNLGLCYYNGEGVEKSAEKAVLWFRKAAEQGNASAQSNLGMCYYNGEGVVQSVEKATVWLQKAVENGDEDAKQFLKNTRTREMGERVFAFRQKLDGVYGQFQKEWKLFCSKEDFTEEALVFSDMVSDLNLALYRISADGLPDDLGALFENLKNMGRRLGSCEEDYVPLVAKDKKLKEDNASGAAKMLACQGAAVLVSLLGGNGNQLMNTSTQVGVGNVINAGSQYGEIEAGKKILYNKINHTKNRLMKCWSELDEVMDRYR